MLFKTLVGLQSGVVLNIFLCSHPIQFINQFSHPLSEMKESSIDIIVKCNSIDLNYNLFHNRMNYKVTVVCRLLPNLQKIKGNALLIRNALISEETWFAAQRMSQRSYCSKIMGEHVQDINRCDLKVNQSPPDLINQIIREPKNFWKDHINMSQIQSQKCIVEFSSPNIAKPFHLGHLRSTVIGNFIGNLLEAFGHNVIRLNYLGDWGTQFGLLQYAFEESKMSEKDLEDDPIRKLTDLYVWANKESEKDPNILIKAKEILLLMEKGDKKFIKNWQLFRNLSVDSLSKSYEKLDIKFDHYHGESMYTEQKNQEVMSILRKKQLIKTVDGCQVFIMPDNHVVKLVKSDGVSLYVLRDIAAALHRRSLFDFDKMFYVVEEGQHSHFKSLFYILNQIDPWFNGRLEHVKFGRISGLSTRKGTVALFDDFLEKAKIQNLEWQQISKNTKVSQLNDEHLKSAEILGTSGLMVADLCKSRKQNIKLEWTAACKETGKTGVRLQYSHCRLHNLEKNCGVEYSDSASVENLTEPSAVALIEVLERYGDVLNESYSNIESRCLTRYLFELSNAVNHAMLKLNVKFAPIDQAQSRLKLFRASRLVLYSGMKILGLQPLTKM